MQVVQEDILPAVLTAVHIGSNSNGSTANSSSSSSFTTQALAAVAHLLDPPAAAAATAGGGGIHMATAASADVATASSPAAAISKAGALGTPAAALGGRGAVVALNTVGKGADAKGMLRGREGVTTAAAGGGGGGQSTAGGLRAGRLSAAMAGPTTGAAAAVEGGSNAGDAVVASREKTMSALGRACSLGSVAAAAQLLVLEGQLASSEGRESKRDWLQWAYWGTEQKLCWIVCTASSCVYQYMALGQEANQLLLSKILSWHGAWFWYFPM